MSGATPAMSQNAKDEYVGGMKDAKYHGEGSMNYLSGDRYTGQWRDGRKNGKGLYVFRNGDRYDGTWVDDQKSGAGTMQYAANKDVYRGQVRHLRYTFSDFGSDAATLQCEPTA
jgi:hypothetical protein